MAASSSASTPAPIRFGFRDPLSGTCGFDVDLAREISRAIFNGQNRIEFRVARSTDRIRAADRTGRPGREDDEHHLRTTQVRDLLIAVLRCGPTDPGGDRSKITSAANLGTKRVCVATGATSALRLRRIVPSATLVETATWADCLVLMRQSGVDAVSTDDPILAGLAARDPWLHLVGPSLGEGTTASASRKDRDELVPLRQRGAGRPCCHRSVARHRRRVALGRRRPDRPPRPTYRG